MSNQLDNEMSNQLDNEMGNQLDNEMSNQLGNEMSNHSISLSFCFSSNLLLRMLYSFIILITQLI